MRATYWIFACALFFNAPFATAQAIHGIMRVVKGDVRILQASDGKEIKAKIGQKVYPKDTITAGKDSRAKIVMVDNNELNISPESKVVIQSYEYKPEADKKSVNINVLYGKIRAKVNQKYEGENRFQVKTPSAVAGVRGTDFFTSYTPSTKATQVVTFEGKVAFGLPGPGGQIVNPVMVTQGTTTSVVAGSPPPPPTAVPKSELAQMEKQSDAEKSDSGTDKGNSREPADSKKGEEKKDKDEGKKEGDSKSGEGEKDKGDKKDSGDKKDTADKKDSGDKKANNGGRDGGQRGSGPGGASASGRGPAGPGGTGPGGSGPAASGPNGSDIGLVSGGPDPGLREAPSREPANMGPPIGGGSMLVGNDLPTGNFEPPPMMVDIVAPIPVVDVTLPPPRNDFIEGVIQNGNRRLLLDIAIVD